MPEVDEDQFASDRKYMVEHDLEWRGIHERRVLDVFSRLPREKFIPAEMAGQAYDDHPLRIGYGQTISQPYMVALMTQLLELKGAEKVLEVGTGSGYQAAALAKMLGPDGSVLTIERVPELAESARKLLAELGYSNVTVVSGDGTVGYPDEAPFDRVIVTAAADQIPQALLDQLGDPGIFVMPVGDAFSQNLHVVHKRRGKLRTKTTCPCIFVPLISEDP